MNDRVVTISGCIRGMWLVVVQEGRPQRAPDVGDDRFVIDRGLVVLTQGPRSILARTSSAPTEPGADPADEPTGPGTYTEVMREGLIDERRGTAQSR